MPRRRSYVESPVNTGDYFDIRDGSDPLAPPEGLRLAAYQRIGETYVVRHQRLKEMQRRVEEFEPLANRQSPASIYERREDVLLLAFLRCKKFNVDAAFKKYTHFCQAHGEHRWLREVDIQLVHRLLSTAAYRVLPDFDRHGRMVLTMDCAQLLPVVEEYGKENIAEIVKAVFGMLELIMSDVRAQIYGLIILADLNTYRLPIVSYMNFAQYKLCLHLCQYCYPIRARGMYLINEPWYVRGLFKMLHPFMKPSVKESVQACGVDFSSIHQVVLPESLPSAFGGTLDAGIERETDFWVTAVKNLQEKWAGVAMVGHQTTFDEIS